MGEKLYECLHVSLWLFVCLGIEMSFREKCQLLKDTMDELKLKIEALEEASESSGTVHSKE